MSKKLFDEFDSVSAKAWKQKIQADLKGADYNETLVTSTDEGIDIKPFIMQMITIMIFRFQSHLPGLLLKNFT